MTGPGVSTLYFEEGGSGFAAATRGLFDTFKTYIPAGATITVEGGGEIINPATGDLVGTWTEAGVAPVVGGATGVYTQGVGMRVVWKTAGVAGNRRVQGSTFMVPVAATLLDLEGTWSTTGLTLLATAATSVVTASTNVLSVWSRPAPGRAGSAFPVTEAVIPDRVTWLRSRRT